MPVPELQALRVDGKLLGSPQMPAGGGYELGSPGRQFELQATVTASQGRAGLLIALSPDGGETVRVVLDATDRELQVDRTTSSLDPQAPTALCTAPLPAGIVDRTLRVFVDGSVLEVYCDDRLSLTTRVYPTADRSGPLRLFREDSDATFSSVGLWKLAPLHVTT